MINLVRYLSETQHTLEIVFFRNVFGVAVLIPWLIRNGPSVLQNRAAAAASDPRSAGPDLDGFVVLDAQIDAARRSHRTFLSGTDIRIAAGCTVPWASACASIA